MPVRTVPASPTQASLMDPLLCNCLLAESGCVIFDVALGGGGGGGADRMKARPFDAQS